MSREGAVSSAMSLPSAPTASPALDSQQLAGTLAPVFLIDEDRRRLPQIAAIAKTAGYGVRLLDLLAPAASVPTRCLALIAVGGPDRRQTSLERIKILKEKHVHVVAFEDGVEQWPLSQRCEYLIAGAQVLIDSATPNFSTALAGILRDFSATESKRLEKDIYARHVISQFGIVGESAAILNVFQTILRVSSLSSLPVLLLGETGTGKELFARALHDLDPHRCKAPHVAVNCGAISLALAESEFFGHKRGAFTGATQDRRGFFRAAHPGTLFLDEIGELDLSLQAKLLRVLQDGRITAVGEEAGVIVNVRIIAATHCDLREMVRAGKFREDLYQRLNVITVRIPPLRERPEDIGPLVRFFLQKHSELNDGSPAMADEGFIDALRSVPLPGNVRQLENVVKWAIVNKGGSRPLNLADLPPELLETLPASVPIAAGAGLPQLPVRKPAGTAGAAFTDEPEYFDGLLRRHEGSLSRSLDHCERNLLEAALRREHGNQTRAAHLIGITPRSVYTKLRKHGLKLSTGACLLAGWLESG